MDVLFLALEPPYPPNDGGRIRTWNLLRAAAHEHDVTLLAFTKSAPGEDRLGPVGAVCRELHVVPWPKVRRPTLVERVQLLAQGMPVASRMARSVEMSRVLESLLTSREPDLIHVDHLYLAPYVRNVRTSAKIMNHSDIEASLQRRLLWMDPQRFSAYWWLKWQEHLAWRAFEIRSLAWFDAHIAVSEKDAAYLQKHSRGVPVRLVPNGVDAVRIRPMALMGRAPTLLFVGRMDYQPNIDAVLWFCHRILPSIAQAVPEVRLLIVGRDPPEQVRRLESPGRVTVTGSVEDVDPYYMQAAAAVVPLRAGGGTRLKILEAMAAGVPVVSTSIGCEGLGVVPGRDLLVADKAATFAAHVANLLLSEEARRALASGGRAFVMGGFTWDRVGDRLLTAYRSAHLAHIRSGKVRSNGEAGL